jgi:hypothetical protein
LAAVLPNAGVKSPNSHRRTEETTKSEPADSHYQPSPPAKESPNYERGYAKGCEIAKRNIAALKSAKASARYALLKRFALDFQSARNDYLSASEAARPNHAEVDEHEGFMMGLLHTYSDDGINLGLYEQ